MKPNNIKIAITGGIGSGKSTVADIIAGAGFPVFSCDGIYAELIENADFLAEIEGKFHGVAVNGKLDRQKLSKAVFGDEKKLEQLNAVTHRKIMQTAFERAEKYGLAFIEVPLLFENRFESKFNNVIVVLRDKKERIKSVMLRSGISEEEVLLRLNSQYDYDNHDFAKYYVIRNNSDLNDLKQKTLELLKNIVANCK